MNYVEGDLIQLALDGKFNAIVHGCNCFCNMGSGIAGQIAKKFPAAVEADKKTGVGDIMKLGTFTVANVWLPKSGFNLNVINAYTQYNYGTKRHGRCLDYAAVKFCMQSINRYCEGWKVGMPLIGAGLAGGNWSLIEKIIKSTLVHVDVSIVRYKP